MNNFGQQLASKIDEVYKATNGRDGFGNGIGAGDMGTDCWRRIWFKLHWVDVDRPEGRALRLFAHGTREEVIFTELLRLIGAEVWTHKPDGSQFGFEDFGGHFKGYMDGVVKLPGFNEPLLAEFKTHNDKNFKNLENKGVKEAFPKHYAQVELYMLKFSLKKCLYAGLNKNDESLYFELIDYDPVFANRMMEKAEATLFGGYMPPRISETGSWYSCKFCPYNGVCFKTKLPLVNCRSCRHSTPLRTGGWECAKGRSEIGTQPKKGCPEHEYMPELI